MLRKNFAATGSFIAEDRTARPRPARLRQPARVQHVPQPPPARLGALRRPRARRSARRGPTTGRWSSSARTTSGCCRRCYVPLADLDRAGALADEAIAMGASALLVASGLPARPTRRATSGSTRCGRRPARRGVPIVFHVGGTGDLIDPNYFHNGLPIPPDFHGGAENFRSVDYMGIPGPPAQTLATMIFDGVFERFPDLRVGVIEQGAIWVPSWMRQMESAFDAFARHEERLQRAVAAAERVRPPPDPRSRRTPPRTSAGSSSRPARRCACSRPTTRTSRAAAARSSASRHRSAGADDARAVHAFYHDNFVDLMGNVPGRTQLSIPTPARRPVR